tara:strand:- start:1821 stop:2714 length:894 start_codon:yes stop_codon:yes gene_type:complete
MIYKLYILLSLSFLFSISFQKYETGFYNANEILNYDSKYDTKDILKSLVLPGWGHYSKGEYKKALVFFCVESIAFSAYYYYNKKGLDLEQQTKNFGDQHWSFTNWVTNYYAFEDSEFRYIFEKEETEFYKDLWEGGHKIEFWYNDEASIYTTGNNDQFIELYENSICPNGICNEQVLNSIVVNKDHHYYENIGKYDHFFAGWDDNQDIYEFQKSSGELIAMSPNKKQYRFDWEKSAEFNRFADYALYAIYTNHILSLLDILVFSKINKNSKFNYRIDTVYDANSKMGIGGIVLSATW